MTQLYLRGVSPTIRAKVIDQVCLIEIPSSMRFLPIGVSSPLNLPSSRAAGRRITHFGFTPTYSRKNPLYERLLIRCGRAKSSTSYVPVWRMLSITHLPINFGIVFGMRPRKNQYSLHQLAFGSTPLHGSCLESLDIVGPKILLPELRRSRRDAVGAFMNARNSSWPKLDSEHSRFPWQQRENSWSKLLYLCSSTPRTQDDVG